MNLESEDFNCIDCRMYQLGCRCEELFCASCIPERRRNSGDWRIVIDRLLIKIVNWWLKHGT
jgi:hypothetical protein